MTLDLKKLFHDVFAPAKSDNVLFIVDLPHVTPDSPKWTRRREMAGRWHAAMESLAKEKGFSVMPIAYYLDVGQHNNSLPDAFQLEADWVKAEALVGSASLIIAMSTWSATAPLHEWVDRYPELRAASLPGITPEMEETALAANYAQIAAYCRVLKPKLDAAEFAFARFSTGDELRLDLRWRAAEMDDGRLHPSDVGKVINLPSGEVFSTLYEGERKDVDSLTRGILPVVWKNKVVRLLVEHNTVVDVLRGDSSEGSLQRFLEEDEARKNIAELGLGCNPSAIVSGNILEDEKAGPHIALGRSDHLGGTVGPRLFQLQPWHQDFSYTKKGLISMDSLIFHYDGAGAETIISRGHYSKHVEIPV
jgi:hypothetical protein